MQSWDRWQHKHLALEDCVSSWVFSQEGGHAKNYTQRNHIWNSVRDLLKRFCLSIVCPKHCFLVDVAKGSSQLVCSQECHSIRNCGIKAARQSCRMKSLRRAQKQQAQFIFSFSVLFWDANLRNQGLATVFLDSRIVLQGKLIASRWTAQMPFSSSFQCNLCWWSHQSWCSFVYRMSQKQTKAQDLHNSLSLKSNRREWKEHHPDVRLWES